MKHNDQHDLIQKHFAGMTSAEESTQLEHALENDPDLRRLYLDYANLDMALGASAEAEVVLQDAQVMPVRGGEGTTRWFSRRPLTSAAAGVMIGVLTSSMVWAYVASPLRSTRMAIPLVDAGFEEVVTPLPKGLPRSLDRWNGDPSHVVSSGSASVKPTQGRFMIKMQPVNDRHWSRFEQIVEVGHLTPAAGGAVEFSASFFCDGAVDKCKMTLVVRAFSLSGDEINGSTRDLYDEMTSTARKTVILQPGSTSWKIGKVRMDLPPNTNTLVFAIASYDLPETSANASRYVDDIKATILITDQVNPL